MTLKSRLERHLRVMKSAHAQRIHMAVWEADIAAVEVAIAALSTLAQEPAGQSEAKENALKLLAAEDERQSKLHDILEVIREQIRLEVAPEHRPDGLFQNIQNAVYAMRGRTPLMNDAAITAALAAHPTVPAGSASPGVTAWQSEGAIKEAIFATLIHLQGSPPVDTQLGEWEAAINEIYASIPSKPAAHPTVKVSGDGLRNSDGGLESRHAAAFAQLGGVESEVASGPSEPKVSGDAAEMRERCARLCDTQSPTMPDREDHSAEYRDGYSDGADATAAYFSSAIRALPLTPEGRS